MDYTTRNTPIGVVLRELSAAIHLNTCVRLLVQGIYKPISSYFVASFRDIHTDIHTLHTHAKFG